MIITRTFEKILLLAQRRGGDVPAGRRHELHGALCHTVGTGACRLRRGPQRSHAHQLVQWAQQRAFRDRARLYKLPTVPARFHVAW